MSTGIEEVILRDDRRGMVRLRPYLPADYCHRAAQALQQSLGPFPILVVTGFLVAGHPETDGPPGALSLHRALRALGVRSLLVSDGRSAEVLAEAVHQGAPVSVEAEPGPDTQVLTFPLVPAEAARMVARDLIGRLRPSAVVAIERCGAGRDGTYRNCRGVDIGSVTAPLDGLFQEGNPRPLTIGVGDGGNEIGMGGLAEACGAEQVTDWPCLVSVDRPIIAAVSNWGAWGLLAALSLLVQRDLLPSEEEFERDMRELVRMHCVDGFAARPQPTVDGFDLQENLDILRSLRELVHCSRHGGFPGPSRPDPA